MQANEARQIVFFIFVAYLFSVAVRLIWVFQHQDIGGFIWNGQLMINTNDGYYFAEKAKEILSGTLDYTYRDSNGAVAPITAFLATVLPFSFESVVLYMPAFLGSLLVVPLVLIGFSLKQKSLGLTAALLASVTWSYYNRTMTGYYDSDMLNIVFPMLVLWSIIHALTVQKNRYLVLIVLIMVLSQWWYQKNIALNTAMVFMAMGYVLIKDRYNLFNIKLLAFALVGLALIPTSLKLMSAAFLFGLFHYKDALTKKYIYPILGVLFVMFLYSGALGGIMSSLNLYLVKRFFPEETVAEVTQLYFFNVINTVREAGAIPFETFANRISGHVLTFAIATIGVGLMLIRNPILILSLPMIAMGFMAYKAGLRFTVYAVPIYALGFSYILLRLADELSALTKDAQKQKGFKTTFVLLSLGLALYPNITHIVNYRVPTVLNNTEVKDLDMLSKIASSKDYTLAWWDYGYPIRYYGHTKTLIDGGKHQNDNFIVSKMLLTPSQGLAARLGRLAIETYVDPNCSVAVNSLFKNKQKDQIDPNLLLLELESGSYTLPKKTRDIYLYLPYRMMGIFPTVTLFGNLDLTTGKKLRNIAFYPTRLAAQKNGLLTFANGIRMDAKKGKIIMGRQQSNVKQLVVVSYTKQGKTQHHTQSYHLDGHYTIVYLKSYNTFVIMDNATFQSTFVQMSMLENYDPKLFELIVSSPYSKIYRLKI